MLEFLNSIDTSLFWFINKTLANPVTDKVMVVITETPNWWIFYFIMGMYLLIKGGAKGRVVVVLTIILIFMSDQSANFLKEFFVRMRPCKALEGVNLLVGCNSNNSMPSGHAINNFAAAALFSHFYPNYRFALYFAASLIALSRVFVGVHYPFDLVVGAAWGTLVALFLIRVWNLVNAKLKIVK